MFIGDYTLDMVEKFTYLGSIISNSLSVCAELYLFIHLFTNIFRLGGPITINVFYLGAHPV